MPAILRKLAERLGMVAGGFPGGIHPDPNKLTAAMPIEDGSLAQFYVLPMKQHIGEACSPIVAVGDRVLRGQKIAKSEGYVSVPVHAPTSGHVIKIDEHHVPHPSGMGMPSIFIEADGEDECDHSLEPITDWKNTDPTVLRERARVCGLAGLGGAVFPTFIKLVRDKRFQVETVVLNGIECEPYLTNDHRMMLEHSEEILSGMNIMMHMVQATSGIIAIEDNKPDAAEAMRQALAKQGGMDNVRIEVLPTRYPQGSEKQLICSLTGKEVPAGLLPMHIGVLCHNVATSKALHDAIMLGRPLTERVVTLSGDAMPNPGNVRVRLGTSMRFVLAERGLIDYEGVRILLGGPMMGERLPHPDVPVIKGSTGLLAMRHETFVGFHQVEQPCIRCGHCSEVCPSRLVPNMLADFCRSNQFEKAENFQLFDCIECGSCSYVCPANVPLVHYFRYGKGQLAQQRREQEFAELSRIRSAAREARLAREAEEKAAKRAKMRKKPAKPVAKSEEGESAAKAGSATGDSDDKAAKMAAAKARRAERAATKATGGEATTAKSSEGAAKPDDLDDKMAAAKARRAARAAAKAGATEEADKPAAESAGAEDAAKSDGLNEKMAAAKARRAARAAAKAGAVEEADKPAGEPAKAEDTDKQDDVAAKVAAAKARRAAKAAAKSGTADEADKPASEPVKAEDTDRQDDMAAKMAAAKARRAARAAAKSAGGKKEKLESDA